MKTLWIAFVLVVMVFGPVVARAEEAGNVAEIATTTADPTGAEKTSFVDRDGDGIQDGMEHRFRRHAKGAKGQGGGTAGMGMHVDGTGGGRGAGQGACKGSTK